MRIAVWHNLPSGGGKRALYDHVRGLHQRGHHVSVWSPPTADKDFLALTEFGDEHVVPLNMPALNARGLRVSRAWRELSWCRRLLRAHDAHARVCAQQIDNGRVDVVLVNPCRHFRCSYIGSYLKTPSVLYLQEPHRELYEAIQGYPWGSMPYRPARVGAWPAYLAAFCADAIRTQSMRIKVREELRMARGFKRILVNSFYSRESVMRAYGLDSCVCYLGVDAEKFASSGEPREQFVLGVGGVGPNKGLARAIQAIGCLPASRRPKIVWVGNFAHNHYRSRMEALAAELGVSLTIKVLVSDAELIGWYSRAVLLLYTPVLEPFGFAPLEAMACETPVVAVGEGGVRETVIDGRNGILVPNADPCALSKAVDRLLADTHLARTLGRQGRQMVLDRWTLDVATERLEFQLAQLAKGGEENVGK